MLTLRGSILLISVLAFTAGAMLLPLAGLFPPHGQQSLALVGLTVLGWFLGEWLLFQIRVGSIRQLVVERLVCDDRGEVANLWAGRTFDVRIRITSWGWFGLPYIRLIDRVPFGVETTAGEPWWEGSLHRGGMLAFKYCIRCPSAGEVRFEGLSLHGADLQGFFYHRTFLPAVRVCRVLPVLTQVESNLATVKRWNLLPPPGIHHHRRPGTGSELLDLRDYLPGDPPRMIAWKVSARRDRLITKEFESDVPVRVSLFVDCSNSVRLGPPGQTPLARMVGIAVAVAQASAGNRDPVGLCIFDEDNVQYLRPARTRRHLSEILNLLSSAAGRKPTSAASADDLLPLAHAFAQEVYPDLMRPEVNAFPAWLPWLFPRSIWTIARPRWSDFLYWLLPFIALTCTGLTIYLFIQLWLALARWLVRGSPIAQYTVLGLLSLIAVVMVLVILRSLMLLFPEKRRRYRWRKQLAALLSARHGLAPGGLALLLEDDILFAEHLHRFLAEHQVPLPVRLYDAQGRYLFASPGKVEVLSRTLLRAVGKGHDNEMFVLLVDLLELSDRLGPLLRAVKVALARHHRVMLVCPWPSGIPAPRGDPTLARPPQGSATDTTMQQVTVERLHASYYLLRRTFAGLGVPVVCAEDRDPAQLIIDRIDRLRTARSEARFGGGRSR